jgi:predicted anti-sigma-YlaC factor YlaD
LKAGDPMQCKDVQKRFSAYQDGEIEPKKRERITNHLQVCEVCRGEFAKLDRLWQALDGLREIQPEPDFYRQVVRKINESYEPRRIPRLKEVFNVFSPLAACTLLVMGLLIGTFAGNYLAGSGLISFQSPQAGKIPQAIEVVSFQVFDPVPPGTLGDGYLRIVRNMETQHK